MMLLFAENNANLGQKPEHLPFITHKNPLTTSTIA
jgi:hypothetical protein